MYSPDSASISYCCDEYQRRITGFHNVLEGVCWIRSHAYFGKKECEGIFGYWWNEYLSVAYYTDLGTRQYL